MYRLILLFALFCFPFTAFCATSFTLSEAVRLGVEKQPAFLAAKAESEAARAGVAEAKSQNLPRVTLSERFVWTNEPGSSLFIWLNQERLKLSQSADIYNNPPDRHDFETRLQLLQPIYNPDIRYGVKRAEVSAQAASAGERAVRDQVAWRVFSAYLDVQRSRSVIDWVSSSVREAQEIHRLAAEKERAGTGLKADTLTASVHLAESRRLQISAENALVLAQRKLALEMGMGGQEVDIAAPLDVHLIAPPTSEQNLQRGDLDALKLQSQETVLARQQSKAAWLPRLNAGASWSFHDRNFPLSDGADSWMVNAQLTWELFDGFSRKHATNRATASERAAKARYRQALDQAQFDAARARLNTETAQLQLTASQSGYAAAEESYQLLASRYRNGLTPLSQLLTAQARVEKSRADLVTAKVQLIQSLAQQHYILGTFTELILK